MPNKSTHGKSWVYATKDKIMSAVFLGTEGGDYTVQVGRDPEGKVFLTERFEGAFELRYSVSGSIYTLSSEGFLEDLTSWNEEVVNPSPVKIISEEHVNDVSKYLKESEVKGDIIISYFPERYRVPIDDSDLVEKAISWVGQFGEREFEHLEKYHPELIVRVKAGLKK